jgi:hypothetical protein
MQSLVFGPLGMTHTTADPDAAWALGLGDAHRIWFGIPTVHAPLLRPDLVPAGFIVSTAADLTRPIEMLVAGGRIGDQAFLSRAGVAALTTAGPSTGVGDARYGMGWVVGNHNGHATVSHDGSTTDMAAFQAFDPGSGDGIVVLANAQAIPYEVLGKIDMIGFGALDLMLGRHPNGDAREVLPARRRRPDRRAARDAVPATSGSRIVCAVASVRLSAVDFDTLRGSRSTAISTCSCRSSAAPSPRRVRRLPGRSSSAPTSGSCSAVFIVLRLTDGALRFEGWWRTGRRPIWTLVGGEVPPVPAAG